MLGLDFDELTSSEQYTLPRDQYCKLRLKNALLHLHVGQVIAFSSQKEKYLECFGLIFT